MSAAYLNAAVTQEAVGALEAQAMIEKVSGEMTSTDHAWLGFVQLASKYGWRSAACRAYVLEIVKRAAA